MISDMELAKRDGGVADPGKNYCLGSRRRIRLSERTDHSGTAAIPEDGKPGWETGNFMVCNPAK